MWLSFWLLRYPGFGMGDLLLTPQGGQLLALSSAVQLWGVQCPALQPWGITRGDPSAKLGKTLALKERWCTQS